MAEVAAMRCEEIREMLPAYSRGEGTLVVRRHLARCADCRAELVRYETLATSLTALRHSPSEPPVGLLAALEAIPSGVNRVDQVRGHLTRNRKAYAGGVAVALVGAAAAGAAVWRSRRLATT